MYHDNFLDSIIQKIILESEFRPIDDDSQYFAIFNAFNKIMKIIYTLTPNSIKNLVGDKDFIIDTGSFIVKDAITGNNKVVSIKICNFGIFGFNPADSTVYLNINDLKKYDEVTILHILFHEMGHILSTRSSEKLYEKYMEKYSPMIKELLDAAKEKINSAQHAKEFEKRLSVYANNDEDFDAAGTDLVTTLLRLYDPEKQKRNAELLEKWIREGGPINNIPSCLFYSTQWIIQWSKNPSLYKRFLNRLYVFLTKDFDVITKDIPEKLLADLCTQENIKALTKWLSSGGNSENIPNCLGEWENEIITWSNRPQIYKKLLNIIYTETIKMKKKLLQEKTKT